MKPAKRKALRTLVQMFAGFTTSAGVTLVAHFFGYTIDPDRAVVLGMILTPLATYLQNELEERDKIPVLLKPTD